MKLVYVNDEQYNDFINSLTIEQKSMLRNNEDNNDDSDDSLAIIRILSNSEYDQYIINSTCDGSISLNNQNVWHHDEPRQDVSINTGHSNYSLGEFGSCVLLKELVQNNIKENACLYSQSKIKVDMFVTWYSEKYRTSHSIEKSMYENKTTKNKKYFVYPNGVINYNSQGSAHGWYAFNISFNYRPVFQYIDNNKSNNIFR